ncbi:MAG: DUF6657 family protein [Desulfobulbus sp.]
MAEIRSTMDLVLERAARMGTASAEELQDEKEQRRGMQLGAEFLDTPTMNTKDLQELLQSTPEEQRKALRMGMLATMFRNLFLPRDEDGKSRVKRAMQALVALNGGSAQVDALCRELQQVAERYGQHRSQIQEQLMEQLRGQIQQALAQETGMKVDANKIDPTMDPRYAQEWAHIEAELNKQYGQALEQYRAELSRLSGV